MVSRPSDTARLSLETMTARPAWLACIVCMNSVGTRLANSSGRDVDMPRPRYDRPDANWLSCGAVQQSRGHSSQQRRRSVSRPSLPLRLAPRWTQQQRLQHRHPLFTAYRVYVRVHENSVCLQRSASLCNDTRFKRPCSVTNLKGKQVPVHVTRAANDRPADQLHR